MKKHLHLTLFSAAMFLAGSLSAQGSFVDRFNEPAFYACDSIIYEEYTGGSTWNPASYIAFTPDGSGRFQSIRFYDDHGVLTTEYRASRNSNGLVDELEYYASQGGTPSLFSKTTYTYSNGKLETEVLKTKDFFSGQFVNSTRATYSYDGSGNMTEIVYEFYLNNAWELSYRDKFTYDGNGVLVSSLQENYFGTSWEAAMRSTYTHDGQGRMLTKTDESWNTVSSTWSNYRRTTNSYGTGYRTNIAAEWQNGNWKNSRKDSVFLDSQMKEQSSKTYEWNAGSWHIRFRSYCHNAVPPMPPASPTNLQVVVAGSDAADLTWTDNASNEYGTVIYRTFDTLGFWDVVDTVAANVTNYTETGLEQDTTYYYALEAYNDAGLSLPSNIDSVFIPLGTGIAQSFGPSFRFYPNPANQHLTIEGIGSDSRTIVSATDLTGRTTILSLQPAGASVTIDLGRLAPGAYLLKIESDSEVRQEKLLINR
ncbi:MAG: T9SS type A sorting domain-containing protein [Bacteroidia bacterium]